MPTDLPRPKRNAFRPAEAKAKSRPTFFGTLLNTFMVGSVLILFAAVLLQEARYVHGEPGTVADGFIQKAQAAIIDNAPVDDSGLSN